MAEYPFEEELAYIGLGANLGDREQSLHEAVSALNSTKHLQVIRCSSIYETDPVGYVDQPPFLNMVVAVISRLSPESLFARMNQIELQLGRVRRERWGPRTIDLDLLTFGDRIIDRASLTLPHPRMFERLFVLIPLEEVLEGTTSPWASRVAEAVERLRALDGKEGIRRWKPVHWLKESGPSES